MGFKFRFTFGIGPTKTAVMVFGPRRNLPTCSVTLGGAELPVVSMYKYLGVVLTPTLRWTQHAQHLVQRGNRLFAQCVSWCRSERLPLAMASSIFMVYVLPSVSWGTEFFSHSPPALRQLDHALRRWGRSLLGWPSGSPSTGVLVELGWPDAERLSNFLVARGVRSWNCFFLGGVRVKELSNHTTRRKNAFRRTSHPHFTSPLGHDATKPTPHGTMASDHQHHHQVSNRAMSWQMRVLLHTPKSLTNAFAMLAPPFSVGWAVRSGLSPWQVSRGTNEFLATTCPRLHRPERRGALCCEAQRILGRSFLYAF